MLGCIYLILAVLLGHEITSPLLSASQIKAKGITPFWVVLSASYGCGTLLLTWAVYIAAWLFSVCGSSDRPLLGANLIVMAVCAIILSLIYYKRKYTFKGIQRKLYTTLPPRKESLFFFILLAGITWIMFYVFHISDGVLYSGFSVFGDYAPHTAMMRSFSFENNFPTQYPHFGGQDVKYHFMFQFLSGNLEYLGMPIDIAYNSVSILSLWCFFMMLYSMGKRFFESMWAGILSVIFVVFRSGTAFFQFVYEHIQAGDLLETLSSNTSFIGYTANENWGLWNFNVYLNQRHLSFGLLMVALALWVFMEWLETGCAHEERELIWLKNRFFSKNAWSCRKPEIALLVGMLLGLCSFWNGAAVIAGLLILMGFAIFSDGKLDYLILALVTVTFSEIQSKMFVWGSVVSPSIYLGFLADEKSVLGVASYLIKISGIVFLGIFVLLFFMKRMERAAAVSFLFPAMFAFIISLTPDINVNHKYIIISYAFLTIFWAGALCRIFRKKQIGKVLAVVLAISLTITGIYDFVVILKDNDSSHRVAVKLHSNLTAWLKENLGKDDLLLTPEYSMNEVTMAGVMLYMGWPYYAWSAGYDTYYRARQGALIYTTEDPLVLMETVEQEHITYILYENGMTYEEKECREDVIADTYPLVYQSDDGRIRIYGTEQ